MHRIDRIRQYLADHFFKILVTPLDLPAEDWFEITPEDPTNLYRPFGYLPPVQVETGTTVFHFCPELIALQTDDLNEEEFTAYLRNIVYTCDLHITHADVEIIQRSEIIDRKLANVAPGGLALLNRVQMAWLDRLAR